MAWVAFDQWACPDSSLGRLMEEGRSPPHRVALGEGARGVRADQERCEQVTLNKTKTLVNRSVDKSRAS